MSVPGGQDKHLLFFHFQMAGHVKCPISVQSL